MCSQKTASNSFGSPNHRLAQTPALEAAPDRASADIVFEYASKSTGIYDRTTKADTYLALGVRELWLVDSDAHTIEIRNAAPGNQVRAWSVRRFGRGELGTSLVLDGWRVSVDSLFLDL